MTYMSMSSWRGSCPCKRSVCAVVVEWSPQHCHHNQTQEESAKECEDQSSEFSSSLTTKDSQVHHFYFPLLFRPDNVLSPQGLTSDWRLYDWRLLCILLCGFLTENHARHRVLFLWVIDLIAWQCRSTQQADEQTSKQETRKQVSHSILQAPPSCQGTQN